MKKVWMYTPHLGGKKIPDPVKERTRDRILAHATKKYAGKFTRIDVRFHGALCYIDAFQEPYLGDDFPPPGWSETREQAMERMRNCPTHLVRLRYFGDEERWTLAFYTYSHEKYEPCLFPNGDDHGSPEEAFDVGAVYLT
jgi:hypothetical protein